jgi:multidrug efflux pump
MGASELFIRRPVATTLLAIGLCIAGMVAYAFLPVASLPNVELPTIRVSASRPGADPTTMATTVAAPLERRLGEISGVTEITSSSSLGLTNITVQFDLNRRIEAAARDVQAAINAAAADLPSDLPNRPTFRKVNPSAAPIMVLALTSDTLLSSAVYDAADSVLIQRISQIEGVAEATLSGSEQPAIRVRVDPHAIASMGISLEDVRSAIVNAAAIGPVGSFQAGGQGVVIATNDRLSAAEQYQPIVVRAANGTVVRLSSIASVEAGVRSNRQAGWLGDRPAVLVSIFKQADSNVIETVDRVRALLPALRQWLPAGIQITVLSDRTATIRASVQHLHLTLAASIALVMMVVLMFLRRLAATIAAGVTIPLSLAGTFVGMWAVGFSLDNVSLMALIISVGFVVDDAIVMIENWRRKLDAGMPPLPAAIAGAREIGFTVVSISVSLVAVFLPLLFMSGVIGKVFSEFALTLTFAIAVSAVVSLTVTPMLCGHFATRRPARATGTPSMMDRALAGTIRLYGRGLRWSLRHGFTMVAVTLATIVATVWLYATAPKGFFPQDDTGLMFGFSWASPDISFEAMAPLQRRASQIVAEDPAVALVGAFVGGGMFSGSVNRGQMFISLKSLEERRVSAAEVAARLRRRLATLPGIQVYVFPVQDLRFGGRQANSSLQLTVWGPDLDEVHRWAPRVLARLERVPGLVDVSSDRQEGGLQANVTIDRMAAARLGVNVQNVDATLNNAFAQRQVATIYAARNQYRVILEIDPRYQRDPSTLQNLYVGSAGGAQVPLTSVARVTRSLAPLSVHHQGQYPAVTISYALDLGVALGDVAARIDQAVAELHLPDTLRVDPAGDALAARRGATDQMILIITALLVIYIVLGVLYESLIHPITILSTLPSAGIGALLALRLTGTELSVIALIGILLLMGIVKKNAIMLVDFAIEGQRKRGLAPEQAIYQACIERFRPIIMTTLTAMLGAIPLVVGSGSGAELRRPLGITVIAGLLLSQLITLYTTPTIYLAFERLRLKRARRRAALAESAALN